MSDKPVVSYTWTYKSTEKPEHPLEPYLPHHMREGMEMYLTRGIPPGGFMMAVLTNDLKGAVGRADLTNLKYLTNIVAYIYNHVPSIAQGSPAKVEAWIKHFSGEEPSDDD